MSLSLRDDAAYSLQAALSAKRLAESRVLNGYHGWSLTDLATRLVTREEEYQAALAEAKRIFALSFEELETEEIARAVAKSAGVEFISG